VRWAPPVGCVLDECLAVTFWRAVVVTLLAVAGLLAPVAAYVVGATARLP
jgi:hypothetical protein